LDETTWTLDGVACVGRSLSFEWSFPTPAFHKVVEDMPKRFKVALDEMEKALPPGPRIRRDWWLARGTDMANVWYDSPADDAVAGTLPIVRRWCARFDSKRGREKMCAEEEAVTSHAQRPRTFVEQAISKTDIARVFARQAPSNPHIATT
jgi:hypothetical protein